MIYLIGGLRIGADIGANLNWDNNLTFLRKFSENTKSGSICVIVGDIFEDEITTSAENFMIAFNLLLNIQKNCTIKICSEFKEDTYTYNISKILGIEKDFNTSYRKGLETKKIGDTYTLACPYYLEGEKRNTKFGYLESEDNVNFNFIENDYSSKTLNVKITKDTDIKELTKITKTKKDDIINVEIDKHLISEINDTDHTDLIVLLNQDNVKVEKHKVILNITKSDDIDFKPNKNFYIKMLVSIIKNKGMTDNKTKVYLKTLKDIV